MVHFAIKTLKCYYNLIVILLLLANNNKNVRNRKLSKMKLKLMYKNS